MLPTPDTSHYPILAAMLAPALLMAATGSLLISANNRLARVVDRLRGTIALRRECSDEAVRAALDRQIAQSRRRSYYVLRACLLFYLALGAFVATSLALAIDALTGFALGQVPAGFAVLGVIALLFGSLAMGLEVHLAVSGLNAELELSLRRGGGVPDQTPGD
jgi:ABC-type transport system involved in cytochrome bd biosynthesis fused ATPase/permease subunit